MTHLDMNQYPLMLNLADKLTVVIGGGPIAVRKTDGMLQAGAQVRMVCPDGTSCGFADEVESSGRLIRVTEAYRIEHLEGATLVFAAATPEVNARVVADSRARGIWVNSADDPETGDFFTPASVRRGDLLIAVGTGGCAPAVARQVRDMLDDQFDEAWAIWLEIHRELRPIILRTVGNSDRRRLFERLADLTWLPQIREHGPEAVRAAMRRVVEESAER
jgi:precorrin-2 dehydrogenase / sirohydrochlorin ferrochelatase